MASGQVDLKLAQQNKLKERGFWRDQSSAGEGIKYKFLNN